MGCAAGYPSDKPANSMWTTSCVNTTFNATAGIGSARVCAVHMQCSAERNLSWLIRETVYSAAWPCTGEEGRGLTHAIDALCLRQ